MSEWEELAGLADAVPVPLLGIDEEGKVRLVNRSGCEFLALARQQLLDHELGELFRDPGRAAEFQTALRRGSADSHRFVCRRGDGGSQRVFRSCTPGRLLRWPGRAGSARPVRPGSARGSAA